MNYQLQDYEVDSIILKKDRIIFSFPNGFYVEDDDGQELKPLRKKLAFLIDKGGCPNEPLESFLSIRRIVWGRKSWKEISLKQFAALFKKGNMVIHDEYDSKMTNWKMIQLNACTNWSNIELFITDIIDVECYE